MSVGQLTYVKHGSGVYLLVFFNFPALPSVFTTTVDGLASFRGFHAPGQCHVISDIS